MRMRRSARPRRGCGSRSGEPIRIGASGIGASGASFSSSRLLPGHQRTAGLSHRLPDYDLGPLFAASVTALDDTEQATALKCVVDVLTDLARTLTSRRVHPLRTGAGGDDAPITRADGAVCYRASIEVSTASARRLHYWKLPNGRIELSRIVLHDDVEP